jgi:hypothetical protein
MEYGVSVHIVKLRGYTTNKKHHIDDRQMKKSSIATGRKNFRVFFYKRIQGKRIKTQRNTDTIV